MENAKSEEHVVAVRKEFLIENKIKTHVNSSPQTVLPSAPSQDNESLQPLQHNTKEADSADGKTESAENVLSNNSEVVAAGEIREGYKSNGYKIDDRDRRDQRKKDFTGGRILL
jgi:hypothetical protein